MQVAGLPLADQPRLRQTAAAILDEQRFSAREIADVLGHSRPSLTQDVYMHRGAANPAGGCAERGAPTSVRVEII
jgi:integrase